MFLENFKLRLKIFIFFTVFLLLEGFFYYYSYKLSFICFDEFIFSNNCKTDYSIFNSNKSGFNPYIWNENRLVEIFQSLLLFFTIILILNIIKLLKKNNSNTFFIYIIYLYLLCILYFFLEEISWGQHIFKWESSNFFLTYNNQGETNIHNISNLFDQLPRGMLVIWCGFSFLIHRYILKFNLVEIYSKFVLPKKELKYLSIIFLIFFLPDFVIDKTNLHPGHANYTININMGEVYDFITFNFIRLSEYQELIFTFYLFNHSLFYKNFLYHKT